jgi:hypothetical protein
LTQPEVLLKSGTLWAPLLLLLLLLLLLAGAATAALNMQVPTRCVTRWQPRFIAGILTSFCAHPIAAGLAGDVQ